MTEQRIDPRQGNTATRLARGFSYLLKGWAFVLRHPSLIKHCVLPFLICLVVFAGVAGLFAYSYDDLIGMIWARPTSSLARVLWYLFNVLLILLAVLLAYGAFFVVQAMIAAPFNDLLSEKVELIAFGNQPPPFSPRRAVGDMGRTVSHELKKISLYLGIMAPLLLLNWIIPVLGQAALLIGGFFITTIFFSYDYLDLCMARRRWTFRQKWRALRRNGALSVGFGSALSAGLLVPLLGLMCIPMAAVGGALLFNDLERAGAFQEPRP